MSWSPQDESTFRDRIVRIERKQKGGWFRQGRRSRDRGGLTLRLPFSSLIVMGLCIVAIKALVLANVSEGAYRAAALDLAAQGPVGQALAVVFGPDPLSLELARYLRF